MCPVATKWQNCNIVSPENPKLYLWINEHLETESFTAWHQGLVGEFVAPIWDHFQLIMLLYLYIIFACVLRLHHGQLMRLPEEQQLLVQEAHLLLGALAVAYLKDKRDKQWQQKKKDKAAITLQIKPAWNTATGSIRSTLLQ